MDRAYCGYTTLNFKNYLKIFNGTVKYLSDPHLRLKIFAKTVVNLPRYSCYLWTRLEDAIVGVW